MKETLCWECENATGGCSWSNHWEHSPVPGWTAVETKIRNNNTGNGSSYIVIDCPPSLGLLSINSMTASNSVLIPVQCEYFAMEAVAAMLSSIANIQKELNPTLNIAGFLLTMYDSSTQLGNEIAGEIRRLFKENALYTSIPRNQSVAEAQAHHLPITYFRSTSKGGLAYANLAKELLEHEQK